MYKSFYVSFIRAKGSSVSVTLSSASSDDEFAVTKKKIKMNKNIPKTSEEEKKRQERAMRFKKDQEQFERQRRPKNISKIYTPPVNNPV